MMEKTRTLERRKTRICPHKRGYLAILWAIVLLAIVSALSWTGNDIVYSGTEDTPYFHNLSANITGPVEGMTFAIDTIQTNITWNGNNVPEGNISSWVSITDASLGMFLINATGDNQTGDFVIPFKVTYSGGAQTGYFNFSISALNDAPYFVNLQNKSFNITSRFDYIINASDEENDIPFTFNITFLDCVVAEWSTRNCSNDEGKTLFNSSQWSQNGTVKFINISFIPSRNDAGNYTINFTVTDLKNNVTPYNASTSNVVTFEVRNINLAPYFSYICNNERNATENSTFIGYINVSDIDEINNLTIKSNVTWFKFNGSNTLVKNVNISTDYNASFMVNFTPAKANVGNWSINISIRDTGSSPVSNYTIIRFYVGYINASVFLQDIDDLIAYITNNYTIYVNATDDDLLIIDKTVYNESLRFSSNISWVTATKYQVISETNITVAKISVYPNSSLIGSHSVNISVIDANNYSIDSDVFSIEVLSNTPPAWNESVQTNSSLTEGVSFYLNLSQNASDFDGDSITFSFVNNSYFPSFSINSSTGMINFTPVDEDIGYHLVVINISDGKISSPLDFNFTVDNVNDAPLIITPLEGNNIVVDPLTSNIDAYEDNSSEIFMWVADDDYKILQKSFYNESVIITNFTISGPNPHLFNFSNDYSFPDNNFPNRTKFSTNFTANKSDVGDYTVFINVSDKGNASSSITFNLSITEVQHNPVIGDIQNYVVSILENLFIDADSSDKEDGNETVPGSNLTYSIANLTSGGDFLAINSTTGIINKSMNQSFSGFWEFNVSVADSTGNVSYDLFNLTVYDYPYITYPAEDAQFNLAENTSYPLNFSSVHSVGMILNDSLNYSLFINGIPRNNTLSPGNGTTFLVWFTPNLTDSICGNVMNLTLNASNAKLSNSSTWNITINNTNSQVSFIDNMDNLDATASVSVNLSSHFSDADASDKCINQTIGFSYTLINQSGATVSIVIVNWTNGNNPSITFSASSAADASYSITAFEYSTDYNSSILSNISSNNFSVSIESSASVSVPSSGGGGGSSSRPASLKLLLPGQVSAGKNSQIILPIKLENTGAVSLNSILLSSSVARDGVLTGNITSFFDINSISLLSSGESKNVTLIVNIDTSEPGIYEINVNASVISPVYSDWGKIILDIREGSRVEEKVVFVEELVIGNPICKEIQETVNEAKNYLASGETELAGLKVSEAINACQQAIAQKSNLQLSKRLTEFGQIEGLLGYVVISSAVALILGMIYYYYRRRALKHQKNH